ncbi:hypothetical protein PYW07_010428 [Mythimna separata]|uniref:RNase NYN domain-containing protein n=1 Tax=Mythimna separata TaxID=271217 RepID=A0AAD7YA39_MYTSE|nr:hypothetical protein PYW07_010428 [Mythimna separata]
MGKPSSTSLSKSSECSVQLNSSKQLNKGTMSAHKMEQLKKKNHKHVRKNINKICNRLQRDSVGSRNNSPTQSSASTPRNLTIVVKNDAFTPQRKRKSPITIPGSPNKNRRKSDSLIVINDDDLSTNNDSCIIISPTKDNPHSKINCSTPIAKRDSKNLQNLIINNFPRTKNSFSGSQSQNETKEVNRTKMVNSSSFLTIDLTSESENKTDTNITVIDVDKSADCTNNSQDCTLVSVSEASLSMSGDSDVTVIQNNKDIPTKQLRQFNNGLNQLNQAARTNLLNIIAQQIFNGCDLKDGEIPNMQIKTSCGTGTDEDAYIKEVILGESKTQGATLSQSRNSVGSNIYHPSRDVKNATGLRMIVIDGSNVAMEHTKGRMFSVEGLKICIDYFLKRGHIVKAFVPRFRCKYGKSTNPSLLDHLERQGMVVYTPSREIKGKTCAPYDDRYIVQCAAEFDGVIVSGDNYRDLIDENQKWRYIIENRILPFTWVNNMLMFPKDPFGRGGPTLEMLLRHPTPSNSRTETEK